MISALDFLSDARLTGLYVLAPDQADVLETYAEELGFAFLPTDLTKTQNQTERFEKMGRDLAFPAWYNPNLDALHDCLTDLSWQPARGYVLLIQSMEEALTSSEADQLKEVLTSVIEFWQVQEIAFWVFFETGNLAADLHLQKIDLWK